ACRKARVSTRASPSAKAGAWSVSRVRTSPGWWPASARTPEPFRLAQGPRDAPDAIHLRIDIARFPLAPTFSRKVRGRLRSAIYRRLIRLKFCFLLRAIDPYKTKGLIL